MTKITKLNAKEFWYFTHFFLLPTESARFTLSSLLPHRFHTVPRSCPTDSTHLLARAHRLRASACACPQIACISSLVLTDCAHLLALTCRLRVSLLALARRIYVIHAFLSVWFTYLPLACRVCVFHVPSRQLLCHLKYVIFLCIVLHASYA
jgi:hypothetical protein